MATAIRAAQNLLREMFKCDRCGKPKVEMAIETRGRGTGHSGERAFGATRFNTDPEATCQCPPATDSRVAGSIDPFTTTRNCWACRNCGATIPLMIDGCALCGYTREKCTSCNGTGTIDSGPHPGGMGEEPCGCYNGYYYPPADGYCTAGCGAAIKHGAKGMCPSCEAQNAPEPAEIDLMVELTKSLARQKAEAE